MSLKEIIQDFSTIALNLDAIVSESKFDQIAEPLRILDEVSTDVGKAWSGSFMGYHSRVYYENFQIPPAGAHFSSEWGLQHRYISDTEGNWVEYDYDSVRTAIYEEAGNPDLTPIKELAQKGRDLVESSKIEINSLLTTIFEGQKDVFLEKLQGEVEKIKILYGRDYVQSRFPKGQLIIRDMVALGQGFMTPPHLSVEGEVIGFRFAFQACENLSKIVKQITNHLLRKERYSRNSSKMNKKRIFIGHGQSIAWKELKDFIQDRLKLEWDEFNRVPIAGIATAARLSQMLDDAGFAFLIFTGEDEAADGTMQARMNVIHESGLFQGRLGFTKAIVLLEEGCKEFSNIHGLGQIRFPKGKIKEVFEEIRQVLEREGII